jgi:CRISPR-associated endonuclease/helicase Cas3
MSLIRAKPNETLKYHTLLAAEVVDRIYRIRPDLFASLEVDGVKDILLFHDLGKADRGFQSILPPISDNRPFLSAPDEKSPAGAAFLSSKAQADEEDNYLVRHELLSGVLYLIANPGRLLEAAAILSHHKPLREDSFNRAAKAAPNLREADLNQCLDWICTGRDSDAIKKKLAEALPTVSKSNALYSAFATILQSLKKSNPGPETRNRYAALKALLHIGDWLASSGREPEAYYAPFSIKAESLRQKISDLISKPVQWREFQRKCAGLNQNVLAIAPTGAGKTEAALLWAGPDLNKLVYLLPTRVTSNAIYLRLQRYFPEKRIGLAHSGALFYLRSQADSPQLSDHLLQKTLCCPITVGTIDTVLVSGFNVRYWDLKEFNLRNSKIIIDEIHSYQAYTMGLIIACLKQLRSQGCSFFIMSATMPRYLRKLLADNIPGLLLHESDELNSQARNEWRWLESGDVPVNDALDRAMAGKKVLIVVNTVNKAIEVYYRLKELLASAGKEEIPILCFHSAFIQKHKWEKEARVIELEKGAGPCIVVSTQVVEVSLDIDFDLMFTENAPIDALVQRAGRVNRGRAKTDSFISVFRHGKASTFVYESAILEKTHRTVREFHGRRITEAELVGMVDRVYEDYDICADPKYRKALTRFAEIQDHFWQIFDFTADDKVDALTRESDVIKIPVIPHCFRAETRGLHILDKTAYQVDMPLKDFKKLASTAKEKDPEGFVYADVDYREEVGLVLKLSMSDPRTTWKRSKSPSR